MKKGGKIDKEDDNEIQELQYMGRVKLIEDTAKKLNESSNNKKSKIFAYRQFLVRRNRSLEIMITNGLSFQ
jgi:hypothetical protein